ncbi:uncharacterized protein Z520_01670 [Fonsecaea multimorphosa CBS 102226]|uniref:SMP-30/Gluconolactonase/LRE-like region domain-containing protein n=1 Tax=Fonsecaea multimorphosa CBS 102226 TaxID=1442371 RepID=A0A0D2KB19_9EURO|nr:uncharacterized protein Z520_01670 [Fonsecaea multimorphosa CBS 102226]KIY03203.1 hypothetical protein Z520_01670 [Fonsecaea multimorphosa CBS 102226]OAL30444.1 hypothetical protein AYO22_01642 [Fonsecaea multimorphosa]
MPKLPAYLSFLSLPALLTQTVALPASVSVAATAPPQATIVRRFPDGTALENLAVRSDGTILLTSLYTREIFYVDPMNPQNVYSIANLPPGDTFTSITEHGDDIFYVVSTSFQTNNHQPTAADTEKVWSFNLRDWSGKGNTSLPLTLVSNITQGGFLDGLTSVDGTDYLLATDAQKPVIWRINTVTGAYGVSLNSSALAPVGTGAVLPNGTVGANGLCYRAPYAYFSNTRQKTFGRYTVGPAGTAVDGTLQILGVGTVIDDLQPVQGNGRGAYLTAPVTNQIVYAPGNGSNQTTPIAAVGGPTSVRWGRTQRDQNTLYISSTGNNTAYAGVSDPASVLTIGGSLSKIELGGTWADWH